MKLSSDENVRTFEVNPDRCKALWTAWSLIGAVWIVGMDRAGSLKESRERSSTLLRSMALKKSDDIQISADPYISIGIASRSYRNQLTIRSKFQFPVNSFDNRWAWMGGHICLCGSSRDLWGLSTSKLNGERATSQRVDRSQCVGYFQMGSPLQQGQLKRGYSPKGSNQFMTSDGKSDEPSAV